MERQDRVMIEDLRFCCFSKKNNKKVRQVFSSVEAALRSLWCSARNPFVALRSRRCPLLLRLRSIGVTTRQVVPSSFSDLFCLRLSSDPSQMMRPRSQRWTDPWSAVNFALRRGQPARSVSTRQYRTVFPLFASSIFPSIHAIHRLMWSKNCITFTLVVNLKIKTNKLVYGEEKSMLEKWWWESFSISP